MDDKNSGKYLAISVRFAIDDQFVYQGKSLAEYELEQENHRLLNEKLTLLYKIGDVLKYGEKLYTEGTPDGEKWDQALYEKTLAFLGAEWVSSYIADGVFLREYVASDIKQWEKDAQAVDAARKEAYDAYFRHKIQETAENFVVKNIACERIDGDCLVVFLTREEWMSLTLEDVSYYAFAAENKAPTDLSAPYPC